MLKTFNINERYEEDIVPFLANKKNQSNYLCSLILQDMEREEQVTSNQHLIQELTQVVVGERDLYQTLIEETTKQLVNKIENEIQGLIGDMRSEIYDIITKIQPQEEGNQSISETEMTPYMKALSENTESIKTEFRTEFESIKTEFRTELRIFEAKLETKLPFLLKEWQRQENLLTFDS